MVEPETETEPALSEDDVIEPRSVACRRAIPALVDRGDESILHFDPSQVQQTYQRVREEILRYAEQEGVALVSERPWVTLELRVQATGYPVPQDLEGDERDKVVKFINSQPSSGRPITISRVRQELLPGMRDWRDE